MSGVGHADLHDGAGQVAGVERLLEHLGVADRLDAHVGAVAAGERADGLDRVGRRRRRRCGWRRTPRPSSSLPASRSTAMIVAGADQRGAGDGGVADAAAAEHGDRVAAADAAGVHGGAEAGHDAAAEQAGRRRVGRRVDLGGTGRRRRASSRRRRRCRAPGTSSVPSARVIFWVALWVAKQYCGLALAAGPALAAHRPPVEDDEVAGRDVGDVGADRLDDAGGLVAEQERELVVDAALAVVQVGVADPAGLDVDDAPRRGPGRAPRWSSTVTGAFTRGPPRP